eukprot:jgi/Chrzof1/4626/Cz14g20140.t1
MAVDTPGSVPATSLLESIIALEKQKLPADEFLAKLEAPKARWRLIYTANSSDATAAGKKQPHKGGYYFPITAVQRFIPDTKVFENGVFLGPLAHLTFAGPFATKDRQLTFDVTSMNVGLGPWKFSIPLKKGVTSMEDVPESDRKKLPFFLYWYVDDDIAVARGRGGGVAIWRRTTKDWEAKAGVLPVYG